MKYRTWLIKMERCEKHVITLFEDGYVVDNRGKKLFVLKKSAMEMIQELEKHNLDVVVGNVQKYYNSNKITHSAKNKYKYTDRVMSGFEFMV